MAITPGRTGRTHGARPTGELRRLLAGGGLVLAAMVAADLMWAGKSWSSPPAVRIVIAVAPSLPAAVADPRSRRQQ